jgi:hypothetical protein
LSMVVWKRTRERTWKTWIIKPGQSWVIKLKLYLWEFFWMELGFKLRTSGFLGRHSTLYHLSNSASHFCNGIFEIMSLELFAWAGLELLFSSLPLE